jgi:hypothetical protein
MGSRHNTTRSLTITAILVVMIASIATATVATESVMAKKKHKTAYELGMHDADPANCTGPDNCHLYITKPGKGFNDHSSEFNNNYIKGWCDKAPNTGSDADPATFNCP